MSFSCVGMTLLWGQNTMGARAAERREERSKHDWLGEPGSKNFLSLASLSRGSAPATKFGVIRYCYCVCRRTLLLG